MKSAKGGATSFVKVHAMQGWASLPANQSILDRIEAWFEKLTRSLGPSGPAAMPNLCQAGDMRIKSIGATKNPYPTKDPTATNEEFKRNALHQCEAIGASYTECTANPLGTSSAEVYCDCCKFAKP